MFGFHDRKEYSYEGNLRTRGGLLYYEYDGLGNVMDVTDRIGSQVMGYRYDAFGDLFTQMAAPYNTNGFTGKQYDAAASLINYSARWYSPNVGRFVSEDTYEGQSSDPLSLNRYAYVEDNPVNFVDPTGHMSFGFGGGGGSDDTGSGGSSTGTGTGTGTGTSGGTDTGSTGSSSGSGGSTGGTSGTGATGSSGGGSGPTLAQLIAQATETFNTAVGAVVSTRFGGFASGVDGSEIQSLVSGGASEYGTGNDLSLNRYAYVGGDPAMEVVPTGYSSYAGSKRTTADPYNVYDYSRFGVKLPTPPPDLFGNFVRQFGSFVVSIPPVPIDGDGLNVELGRGLEWLGDAFGGTAELTETSEATDKLAQEAQAAEGTGEADQAITQLHHIFPQQFRNWFSSRGVNIDDFTIRVERGLHLRGLHGKGGQFGDLNLPGGWNSKWSAFIKANPNVTTSQIVNFGNQLLKDYGLSEYGVVPYKR